MGWGERERERDGVVKRVGEREHEKGRVAESERDRLTE